MTNAASAANAQTRPIPKSVVQRALEGVRYAITGVAPENWFGPMQPLAPMAPAEVAGRRFDYPTGYNLQYTPRSYEPVGFADLRALADNCDILRLVIETRKDQIEAQAWDIRPKKAADGTRPRVGDFAADIATAKNLLAFPDREHDFAQWTRQIAEEMFVTDATSIYKRRDRLGRVAAFEIIDGTTIAPRIDQWGRTPAPPDVAYQQILHGVPAADYAREGQAAMSTDELIYFPRNKRPGHVYGQSPVEQIILTANIVTRRSLHQLAYYTDGNLTDAIFTAPSGWTTDQIQTWQSYWNALFSGNLRERRHGIWVPDGTKYVALKDIVLKDAFDEYLARLVCFCFSISPQPFVSQVNRATAETAKAQATEEGLGPVLNWFKRLLDILLQRHLGYAGLEFVWIDDREMDASAADAIDVADVKAGIRSINEVRASRGLDPVAGCDALMVATGAGYVPVVPQNAPQPMPPAPTAPHARKRSPLAKYNQNHWPAGSRQGGQFAPKGEGGTGASAPASNSGADATRNSAATDQARSDSQSAFASERPAASNANDSAAAGDAKLVPADFSPDNPERVRSTTPGELSAAGEAQSDRAAASVDANTDSFGNWITPNEQSLIDQPSQPVTGLGSPSRVAVSGVGNVDASAIPEGFGGRIGPNEQAPMGERLQEKTLAASPTPVGAFGYVPAPGDEELLARAIFAEGSNTTQDMPALAWAIINRIGRPTYPDTLAGVIKQQPNQFAFYSSRDPAHPWKDKADQFDKPQTLDPGDRASLSHAFAVAQGVLAGSIPDPTGGATHFFNRQTYNGTPETAPPNWQFSLRDNRYSPSPYIGSHGNHFFLLNPKEEWLSTRRSRR